MSEEQIRHIIVEVAGLDESLVRKNTPLNRANGIDAITFAKIILRIEAIFRIVIDDEDAADLTTLSALSEYVDNCTQDGHSDYVMPSERERSAWYYE